jgi:hypothetical protein
MGYKTIQAKRNELSKRVDVFDKLVGAAKSISVQMEKITKQEEQMKAVLAKVSAEMDKLDTKGIKEFDDYKKSLIGIANGGQMRLLPSAPLEHVVMQMRKNVDTEYWAWVEKQAANTPAQIQPGMVFVDKKMGWTYEIKSAGKAATNANLKGDAAIFYDVVRHDERTGQTIDSSISKAALSPREGVKFVKT